MRDEEEKIFLFGLPAQDNIKPTLTNSSGELLGKPYYLKHGIFQLLYEKIQELKSHICDSLNAPVGAGAQEQPTCRVRGWREADKVESIPQSPASPASAQGARWPFYQSVGEAQESILNGWSLLAYLPLAEI